MRARPIGDIADFYVLHAPRAVICCAA